MHRRAQGGLNPEDPQDRGVYAIRRRQNGGGGTTSMAPPNSGSASWSVMTPSPVPVDAGRCTSNPEPKHG